MIATPVLRTLATMLVVLVASATGVAAQELPGQSDSSRAQIHTSLRAFYFNIAHRDWDAVTAEILPAKILAHRPAPEHLVATSADAPVACSSTPTALVEQATITFDGDWAAVSVPRCRVPLAGADEFRLIHFESRWRFVYIHLFEEPVIVSTDH